MEELLKKSINRIKENLTNEVDDKIRLGLYMALTTIKNEILIADNEELLNSLSLNEDLERYL